MRSIFIKKKKTGIKNLKNITTYFGKESEFKGILKFSGNVQIEGRIKGTISGEGNVLIGETAKIESDIHALTVINYGEIRGNIYAKKEIELHVPGKVYGNIEAPSVEIEKGVIFEGTSWQRKPKLTDDEKLEIKKSLNELKDI